MPIRKGDGTPLTLPGFSEVRKGDGTILWQAVADGVPMFGESSLVNSARHDGTDYNAATDAYYICNNDGDVKRYDDLSSPPPWTVVTSDSSSTSNDRSVRASPDGNYVAIAFWDSPEVRVYDTTDGSLVNEFSGGVNCYTLSWDPDTTWLACGMASNQVLILNVSDWTTNTLIDEAGSVRAVDFSPNGDYIAYGQNNQRGTITVRSTGGTWDLVDSWDMFTSDVSASVSHVSWSPDGNYLATGSWDSNRLQVNNMDGGSRTSTALSNDLGGSVYSVAWYPYSDYFIVGEGFGGSTLYAYSTDDWSVVDTDDAGGIVETISIKPLGDGNHEAAVGTRSGLFEYDVSKVEPSSLVLTITSTNSPVDAGEVLDVNFDVTNTTDTSIQDYIDLYIDDNMQDWAELTVGAGETVSSVVSWETGSGHAGTYTARIEAFDTDHDPDSTSVTVEEPFPVTIEDWSAGNLGNYTLETGPDVWSVESGGNNLVNDNYAEQQATGDWSFYVSMSGLPYYPQSGDIISGYQYAGDAQPFYSWYADNAGGGDGYMVMIGNALGIEIRRLDDGSTTLLADDGSVNITNRDWYDVETEIDGTTYTCSVYEVDQSTGDRVGGALTTISTTDSTHSSNTGLMIGNRNPSSPAGGLDWIRKVGEL